MRRMWMAVVVAAAVVTVQAGPLDLFRGEAVELKDLVDLSAAGLDGLKPTEHAVLVAQVALERAKLANDAASQDEKAAKQFLDTEQLDHKAARSEEKAARANKDENRLAVARLQLAAAEEELNVAKALVDWKELVNKTRSAEVDRAKAQVDLAEAQRDLARVQALIRESVPAASNYQIAEFESRVRKRQKDADDADRKVERVWAKAEQQRQTYERLAAAIQTTTGS